CSSDLDGLRAQPATRAVRVRLAARRMGPRVVLRWRVHGECRQRDGAASRVPHAPLARRVARERRGALQGPGFNRSAIPLLDCWPALSRRLLQHADVCDAALHARRYRGGGTELPWLAAVAPARVLPGPRARDQRVLAAGPP